MLFRSENADKLDKKEEARKAEEARLAEEARKAEEARLAEEARKAEEAKKVNAPVVVLDELKEAITLATAKIIEAKNTINREKELSQNAIVTKFGIGRKEARDGSYINKRHENINKKISTLKAKINAKKLAEINTALEELTAEITVPAKP